MHAYLKLQLFNFKLFLSYHFTYFVLLHVYRMGHSVISNSALLLITDTCKLLVSSSSSSSSSSKTSFKNRSGSLWEFMEILVVITTVVIAFFAQALYFTMLIRNALQILQNDMQTLDESLAEAIGTVMENVNLEGIETPNPLQMMLFELIKGGMERQPQDVAVIERNPDGKFTKS